MYSLSIFFLFLFAIILFTCVFMVIFSTNTVHSILYLVLVFCNATAILLLLNLDYIAMIYIVVYVGAIAILFLFVVMMLNIKLLEIKENFWVYTPLAFIIGLLLCINFIYLYKTNSVDSSMDLIINEIDYENWDPSKLIYTHVYDLETGILRLKVPLPNPEDKYYTDWISTILGYENIQAIGLVLYSYYGFSFVLSSLILLVAMMGSIMLTLKEVRTTKRQDVFKQTQADFVKTINKR